MVLNKFICKPCFAISKCFGKEMCIKTIITCQCGKSLLRICVCPPLTKKVKTLIGTKCVLYNNTCNDGKKKYLVIVFVHLEKDSSMEIAQMLKIKFND